MFEKRLRVTRLALLLAYAREQLASLPLPRPPQTMFCRGRVEARVCAKLLSSEAFRAGFFHGDSIGTYIDAIGRVTWASERERFGKSFASW